MRFMYDNRHGAHSSDPQVSGEGRPELQALSSEADLATWFMGKAVSQQDPSWGCWGFAVDRNVRCDNTATASLCVS